MGDPAPQSLGRYQIIKHLATGGMAEVLLARCAGPVGYEHYVIKRVHPDHARDPSFVRMFLNEAQLAASLHHPNIVRVYEIGEQAGEFFFAMEYVHGKDLRSVLGTLHRARDQAPIALVTGIVAAAAAGLHHAHMLPGGGIVHRDVSPANIIVGYDGVVKVVDFGIAKAALKSVETRSGALKGKVGYMSPEQVTGRKIDRRSDVFALGIVLYELVTARRLFKGANDFLTMSSIVQGNIPPPSQHRPGLPQPLEAIILKALAGRPEDRFQSADELRAALEAFTQELGMRMSQASIADYMKKLFGARREPWLSATDDEQTALRPFEFDGSASGLVSPPPGAVRDLSLPVSVRASSEAPIVYARADLTGAPAPQRHYDPSVRRTIATPATLPPPPPKQRQWRRGLAMAAGAILLGIAGGAVFAVQQQSSSATPASAPSPGAPTIQPIPSSMAAAETAKPAVETATPAVEPPKPKSDAVKPKLVVEKTVDAPKPAVDAPKPAADAAKPAVAAPKPAVAAPKPAVETSKPAVETSKPAVETSKAAVETARPAVEKPRLAPRKPPAPAEPAKPSDAKPAESPPTFDPNSLFPR